jgi:hypothetical protein
VGLLAASAERIDQKNIAGAGLRRDSGSRQNKGSIWSTLDFFITPEFDLRRALIGDSRAEHRPAGTQLP